MNVLVINDIGDYHQQIKNHFSLTKGYYFSKGLSEIKNNNIYFLTTGANIKEDNLNFINDKNIDEDFLKNINLILLIKESNFVDIIEKYPLIKNWIFEKKENQYLAIKSDSLTWVYSKANITLFKKKYNMNWVEFVANYFDILFVQTEEFRKFSINIIKRRFGTNLADKISKKIFISRMGVPDVIPFNDEINPYDIKHSYCLDNHYKLKNDYALHALPYTLKNRNYNKNSLDEYDSKKTIIIYTGRIKVNGGKIFYDMRDIMKKLGNQYELHLFPGRFILPDIDVKVWSPKYTDNLQTIRDYIFGSCSNVIIHHPYDMNNKTKWVQHADIGIDFSSARPNNKKTEAGHAKVLEYCYYGLKVVCEKNICNSYLVSNANNGILLDNIASVDEYVDAIKKVREITTNKIKISQTTINDSGWEKISQEFDNYFKQKSKIGLV